MIVLLLALLADDGWSYRPAPSLRGRPIARWTPHVAVLPHRPQAVEVTVRTPRPPIGPVLPSTGKLQEYAARASQRAYSRCLAPKKGSWDDLSLEVLCKDDRNCRKQVCDDERGGIAPWK